METVLHDAPMGFVSLRTINDETFRVSHPAEISDTVLTRILHGLQKQQKVRLLQTLVTGNPEPTSIFTATQIEFLSPLLKNALAQATKEEEVYFRLTNSAAATKPVEGLIFVYGPDIIIRLKPMVARETKNALSTKSYQSGLAGSNFQVTFSPQEAVRAKNIPQIPYLSSFNSHRVLINIQQMKSMTDPFENNSQEVDNSKPILQHETATITKPSVAPLTSTSSSTLRPKPLSTSPRQIRETSTLIQQLQEQMEILKKQLGEQQAEIERLKKQQR